MNHDKRTLIVVAVVVRALAAVLLALSSRLPSFDASAEVVLGKSWLTPLLRWDVFHFIHIAQHGYVFEHEWAFFPGVPYVLWLISRVSQLISQSVKTQELLLVGSVMAMMAVDGLLILYDLTEKLFGSRSFAFLAALLSLFPSSPATLYFASLAEPLFTYLSYKGMIYCARKQWVRASIAFTLASFCRSNGILLTIYLLWGMIAQPVLQSRELPKFSVLIYTGVVCALPLIPSLGYQYAAYRAFCNSVEPPSWCSNTPPAIYTYVQSTYWNVGLFRYWTLQQLPNILLAFPVLALLLYGSITHIRHGLCSHLIGRNPPQSAKSPFFDLSVTPHAIHSLFLATTLLIASHTQIALRLASSLPFLYWTGAHLWISSRNDWKMTLAKWWTAWSIVWGAVSLVLWGVFLPPA